MKKIIMVILGICWMLNVAYAQEVASFRDWKKSKVQEGQNEIAQLDNLEKNMPARFGPEEQAKLKQSKINLDIAQDLNAQDYFILYLSPKFQNDQLAYSKAVKMMAPEDVAEILVGYEKLIEERKQKSLIPVDSMRYGDLSTISK